MLWISEVVGNNLMFSKINQHFTSLQLRYTRNNNNNNDNNNDK